MSFGASSVRTVAEFRLYFPNATFSSPLDYLRPEPLDTYRTILIAAFTALLVVGISANGWVARVVGIVLRQTRTEAPRAVQIFILALCACDVFVLVFLCFLVTDLWYGQWVFGYGQWASFLCQSYLMSESLSKFYSPFLLVELSGFCYLSVRSRRQEQTSPVLGTSIVALLAVGLALALAFAFMTPVYMYGDVFYLVLYNESEVTSVMAKCAFQPPDYVMTMFTVYSFICGYLIPACLFTIFYAALLIYVHKRRRKSSCTTVKSLDYFSKVARTSCSLVLFYFVSWTPYWAMCLWHYMNPMDESDQMSNAAVILNYFIHMLPYVNCNAYPLLYTILNRSIQHDYLRACEQTRSMRQRRKESESFHSSVFKSSFRSNGGSSFRASLRKSESNSTNLASPNHATTIIDQQPFMLTVMRTRSTASTASSAGSRSIRSLNRLRPPSPSVSSRRSQCETRRCASIRANIEHGVI